MSPNMQQKTEASANESSSSFSTAPPEKVPDYRIVEDMLSKELQQLSFQKRSAIQEEMHGVRSLAVEETEETIEKGLQDLKKQVELIPANEKQAYLRAEKLPGSYVMESDFRLRFLRSELFDAVKAAKRMVGFLDLLLEYYGDFALMRPIKMSDLGKASTDILRSGETIQMLPLRDRSGRRIFTVVGDFGLKFDYDSRVKLYLYMFYVVTDDVETQRRGVIFVIWPGPNNDLQLSNPDKKEHVTGGRIFGFSPIRICAIHLCMRDGPMTRMIKAGLTLMLGSENRSRVRFDSGEGIEIMYKLMGYGIPVDLVPLTDTGNVKTKHLMQWIKLRKTIENQKSKDDPGSIIECPFKNDVIIRFGKAYTNHPGTSMFRSILEHFYVEHSTAVSKESKVAITWKIIAAVEKKGGRFLVWNSGGWWQELTDRAQVRAKVAVSMKDHSKRIQAMRNVQEPFCSTFQFERQDFRKRKRTDGDQCCSGAPTAFKKSSIFGP